MTASVAGWQRARQPEQVEIRRQAILDAARAMLAERAVNDISLRELSDRVGLAKSNVLRYFESREAIFLEILDEQWKQWLDIVTQRLAVRPRSSSRQPFARQEKVAATLAQTLSEQRLLCDLIGVMSSVLERNITVEFAREFRGRASANTARLAKALQLAIPVLDEAGSLHAAGAAFFIVAGLWPYANPADAVADGADPSLLLSTFTDNLTEGLTNILVGLTVRAG